MNGVLLEYNKRTFFVSKETAIEKKVFHGYFIRTKKEYLEILNFEISTKLKL